MKRKRLLLVTPPYHAGVLESAGRWPNLGFIYLAGHARQAGYAVQIYDAMSKMVGYEEIAEAIARFRPDYVGTTAVTASSVDAVKVLRTAKEADPNIITLIGGIHSNFMFRETLDRHPAVDYVVRGEGEETLPELLQALDARGDVSKVRGIAYRKDGAVVMTPDRPFVKDLDALIPAWDLVDWPDYTFYVFPGSRLGLVQSTRGCMNACSFCSQQLFWNRTYRQRSPESFVSEIEHLRDRYGVTVVMLSDEYPTRDRRRWERILDLLIERQVGVEVLLETCVPDIIRDEDLMPKYVRAGIRHVYVGVEATNNGRLDLFKKSIQCEQSREALRILNDAGIITECSFVLGMPDETWESVRETLELARHYSPDMPHFLTIAPWPYADLYPQLKEHVVDRDYSHYNFVTAVVKPRSMTTGEVMDAIVHCYKTFYMEKMQQIRAMPDGFKKEYMIRSFHVMMKNSFLRKLMGEGAGHHHHEMAR